MPERILSNNAADIVDSALYHWGSAAGTFPLGLWQTFTDQVSGEELDGGHFFPEELTRQTAEALARFLLKDQNSDS